jgi:hypothetical protein
MGNDTTVKSYIKSGQPWSPFLKEGKKEGKREGKE